MSSEKMWANRASVNSAFVIRFGDGADTLAQPQSGTVEHVASGERSSFSSWAELQSFVAEVLTPRATETTADEEDRK